MPPTQINSILSGAAGIALNLKKEEEEPDVTVKVGRTVPAVVGSLAEAAALLLGRACTQLGCIPDLLQPPLAACRAEVLHCGEAFSLPLLCFALALLAL